VTAAELLYGVARMPAGHRKTELAAAVGGLLGNDFRDRVLPFDERCASRYADIAGGRETLGQPIGVADAQIAAICRTAEATLATRNTDDFSGTGIELINPWKLDRPEPA
jgi:toxin FitB